MKPAGRLKWILLAAGAAAVLACYAAGRFPGADWPRIIGALDPAARMPSSEVAITVPAAR